MLVSRISLELRHRIFTTTLTHCFSHLHGSALAQQTPLELPAPPDLMSRIKGEVFDAVSHQPLSEVRVSVLLPYQTKTATTDLNGRFYFDGLPPSGHYEVYFQHQLYSQASMGGVRKIVEVSQEPPRRSRWIWFRERRSPDASWMKTASPVKDCTIVPRPADIFKSGMAMRGSVSQADGFYRIYEIDPGRYWITAQCQMPAEQHLSGQLDPAPTSAYPIEFYPGQTDVNSAEILTLSPGEERSGIDIRLLPVYLTSIHGKLAGSADWRGRKDLGVVLVPLDPRNPSPAGSQSYVDVDHDSFELRQVPPGSYRLLVFTQNLGLRGSRRSAGDRIGGETRIDVAGHPIEVSLELHRAVDISGKVEIQLGNDPDQQIEPTDIRVQLVSDYFIGNSPPRADVNKDGTFTIKSVPPGEWRIVLWGPFVFVKSAWFGSKNIGDRPLDLTFGAAAPLRILASTNSGTIHGTAPAGSWLLYARLDESYRRPSVTVIKVGVGGEFELPALAPGRYRLNIGESSEPLPEEGAQEATVGEGETATVELGTERK